MIENRVKFALEKMITPENYILPNKNCYDLKEKSSTGKSILHLNVGTEDNICVGNYDSKKRCNVFLGTDFGMQRCVDHFVLRKNLNQWELHMIEMKKTVHLNSWEEIKEQFRGGYWNIKALTLFLGISLEWKNIFLYIAYGDEDSNIITRPPNGIFSYNAREEWATNKMTIEILPRELDSDFTIEFQLRKIKMLYLEDKNRLEGNYNLPRG